MDLKVGDLVEFDNYLHPIGVGVVIDTTLEYDIDGFTWRSVVVMSTSGEEIIFSEDEVVHVEADNESR